MCLEEGGGGVREKKDKRGINVISKNVCRIPNRVSQTFSFRFLSFFFVFFVRVTRNPPDCLMFFLEGFSRVKLKE